MLDAIFPLLWLMSATCFEQALIEADAPSVRALERGPLATLPSALCEDVVIVIVADDAGHLVNVRRGKDDRLKYHAATRADAIAVVESWLSVPVALPEPEPKPEPKPEPVLEPKSLAAKLEVPNVDERIPSVARGHWGPRLGFASGFDLNDQGIFGALDGDGRLIWGPLWVGGRVGGTWSPLGNIQRFGLRGEASAGAQLRVGDLELDGGVGLGAHIGLGTARESDDIFEATPLVSGLIRASYPLFDDAFIFVDGTGRYYFNDDDDDEDASLQNPSPRVGLGLRVGLTWRFGLRGGDVSALRLLKSDLSSLSDEELAVRAANEDRALALVFDRFHARVYRYLTRLVGPSEAEDLLQQTFIELARGRAIYDGRASVQAWLFGIATNMARRHRRSIARRVRLVFAVRARDVHRVPSLVDETEGRDDLRRAQAALAALPEGQREAFALNVLEGLPAREVGEILGLSEAAVWKRVSKARARVRAALEEET